MKVKHIVFFIVSKIKHWIYIHYLRAKVKDGYHEEKIGEGVIAGPDDFIQLCTAALKVLESKDKSLYDYLANSVGFTFYPRDDKIGFFTNISYGLWPIRLDRNRTENANLASALESIVIYAYLRKSCILFHGFPTETFSISQHEVHGAAKARVRDWLWQS